MATVLETYTWAVIETELKFFLTQSGCVFEDPQDDAELMRLLDAAGDAADTYMQNPFDGSHVLSPIVIPESVKQGVLEWVKLAFKETGTNRERPMGLSSAKTGDLQETYVFGAITRHGVITHEFITDSVKGYWRSLRRVLFL